MLNIICASSFINILSWVGYALIAVLILLIMITVHEFGHYVAAKMLHFKVLEFSIGFGKSIFTKIRKSGEKFSLRVIPFGGYCSFPSEEEEGSFDKEKPWKRIVVLSMGAIFNFLFALLIIIIMFFSFGQTLPKVEKVFDSKDIVDSQYVLQEGDLIVSINDKTIYMHNDLTKALKDVNLNELVDVKLIRDGEELSQKVLIRKYIYEDENNEKIDKIGLGILRSSGTYRFSFFSTLGRSFVYVFKLALLLIITLGEVFVGIIGLNELGGPVTTIVETTKIVSYGFIAVLQITALIGVNLAVFNLLPIPSLDGSQIVFTLIEMIKGKPIDKKLQNVINGLGFLAIIIFVIIVDILHFML